MSVNWLAGWLEEGTRGYDGKEHTQFENLLSVSNFE